MSLELQFIVLRCPLVEMLATTNTKEIESPETFLQDMHLWLCDGEQPRGFGRSHGSGGGGQRTWKILFLILNFNAIFNKSLSENALKHTFQHRKQCSLFQYSRSKQSCTAPGHFLEKEVNTFGLTRTVHQCLNGPTKKTRQCRNKVQKKAIVLAILLERITRPCRQKI